MISENELSFVALCSDTGQVDWLKAGLAKVGRVVAASSDALDDLSALVDVTGSSVLFVSLNPGNVVQRSALIEGILGARPMLSVVAVGDGMDNALMLAAMRSGARDFISFGARASELAGLVRRLGGRLSVPAGPAAHQADLLVLANARPDAEAALIALHLAIALQQEPSSKVLLIDLGQPRGEAMAVLNVQPAFTFDDALRNLRRLDATLIESALPKTENGLRVLSLGGDPHSVELIPAAELYLMLGNLRGYFTHIVVNLAGVPECELVYKMVGSATRLLWMIDQSVPSCQQNLAFLHRMRDVIPNLKVPELVVDRFLPGLAPDRPALERTFKSVHMHLLSSSPELRLKAKNLGQSVFAIAPGDALCHELRAIVGATAAKPSLLNRLFNRAA